MNIIKILTIIGNIGFIIYISIFLIEDGLDNEGWLGLLLIFICISSVYFIVRPNKKNNSYLSLFFKRKALEEKKKIKQLDKNER